MTNSIKKKLITLLLAITPAFITSLAQPMSTAKGLKDAYKDYFKVGVALNTRNFSEAEQQLTLANYNSVTCENAMKPGELHPAEGVWKWKVPTVLPTGVAVITSRCVVIASCGIASLPTG